MDILKTTASDAVTIKYIVHETIIAIYPKYYPKGAVEFFLSYHSMDNIKEAIDNEKVYLFKMNNEYIGTGSISNNEIGRLFILPKYQGKGYGTKALDFLEKEVFKDYNEITLSSSFPAYELYLKRGYVPFEYKKILTDNGDYLCFSNMKLIKH